MKIIVFIIIPLKIEISSSNSIRSNMKVANHHAIASFMNDLHEKYYVKFNLIVNKNDLEKLSDQILMKIFPSSIHVQFESSKSVMKIDPNYFRSYSSSEINLN